MISSELAILLETVNFCLELHIGENFWGEKVLLDILQETSIQIQSSSLFPRNEVSYMISLVDSIGEKSHIGQSSLDMPTGDAAREEAKVRLVVHRLLKIQLRGDGDSAALSC